jgi:Polyketide cyclase / dehydrase and lipid transport
VTSPVAVTRIVDLPVQEAWDLVVDPRNHARWIPLTRITVTGWPLAVGSRVRAVSGPLAERGVPGLPDNMRLDVLSPPGPATAGEAVFTKVGPVLLGSAGIYAARLDDDRTAVTWTEDVHLAGPLPRALTAAVLAPVLGLMLRYALRGVAREARRRHA